MPLWILVLAITLLKNKNTLNVLKKSEVYHHLSIENGSVINESEELTVLPWESFLVFSWFSEREQKLLLTWIILSFNECTKNWYQTSRDVISAIDSSQSLWKMKNMMQNIVPWLKRLNAIEDDFKRNYQQKSCLQIYDCPDVTQQMREIDEDEIKVNNFIETTFERMNRFIEEVVTLVICFKDEYDKSLSEEKDEDVSSLKDEIRNSWYERDVEELNLSLTSLSN